MEQIMKTLMEFNSVSVAVRLLVSLLLGGLIGMERGRHGRAAGMRTHVLVCVGSCMTALVGLHIGEQGDVSRIAAQVISGIGFLGAGTIMIRNQSIVTGLTTAAGIWCTATIGIALGYGFYLAAFIATVITFLTATLLTRLEGGKKCVIRCYVELKDISATTATVAAIEAKFPSAKVAEVVSAKSGLVGSVGLFIALTVDEKQQKNYLFELENMENILFAIEE